MRIPIVDEQDVILEYKDIGAVDFTTEIHRSSAIWLYNSAGEVLIAQRAFDKYMSPGAWGPSAAGVVEEGEGHHATALKETEEELGFSIDPTTLTEGPKILMRAQNPDRRYYMQFYYAPCEEPVEAFSIEVAEVAAVRWVAIETLVADIEQQPEQYLDIVPKVLRDIPITN